MDVIENIFWYVKKISKKNLKINRWAIFRYYANFDYEYLKIGLCDLFPVLFSLLLPYKY